MIIRKKILIISVITAAIIAASFLILNRVQTGDYNYPEEFLENPAWLMSPQYPVSLFYLSPSEKVISGVLEFNTLYGDQANFSEYQSRWQIMPESTKAAIRAGERLKTMPVEGQEALLFYEKQMAALSNEEADLFRQLVEFYARAASDMQKVMTDYLTTLSQMSEQERQEMMDDRLTAKPDYTLSDAKKDLYAKAKLARERMGVDDRNDSQASHDMKIFRRTLDFMSDEDVGNIQIYVPPLEGEKASAAPAPAAATISAPVPAAETSEDPTRPEAGLVTQPQ